MGTKPNIMTQQEINTKAHEYASKQSYFKTYKNENYQHLQTQKAFKEGAELMKPEIGMLKAEMEILNVEIEHLEEALRRAKALSNPNPKSE